MDTPGISSSTQPSGVYGYTDHATDYIPKTKRWNGQKICETNQGTEASRAKCCTSANTLDRIIDKAYQNGVPSHLGIKAIEDYRCVSEYEMGRLANDLQKKIQEYGIKIELPEGLNPKKMSASASEEIISYCKEVIFEKLAQDLDRPNSGKPLAFSARIVEYCLDWFLVRPNSDRDSLLAAER